MQVKFLQLNVKMTMCAQYDQDGFLNRSSYHKSYQASSNRVINFLCHITSCTSLGKGTFTKYSGIKHRHTVLSRVIKIILN